MINNEWLNQNYPKFAIYLRNQDLGSTPEFVHKYSLEAKDTLTGVIAEDNVFDTVEVFTTFKQEVLADAGPQVYMASKVLEPESTIKWQMFMKQVIELVNKYLLIDTHSTMVMNALNYDEIIHELLENDVLTLNLLMNINSTKVGILLYVNTGATLSESQVDDLWEAYTQSQDPNYEQLIHDNFPPKIVTMLEHDAQVYQNNSIAPYLIQFSHEVASLYQTQKRVTKMAQVLPQMLPKLEL